MRFSGFKTVSTVLDKVSGVLGRVLHRGVRVLFTELWGVLERAQRRA